MVYCNPFLDERGHLEEQVLGDAFDRAAGFWHLDAHALERNVNIIRLLEWNETIIDAVRPQYLAGVGTEEERQIYMDQVIFHLFHRSTVHFDGRIAEAHESGLGRRRSGYFREFLDAYAAYLGLDAPIGPADLFALFFQIRRAFFHIFRFLAGRTEAATRLRGRIWESIFTHDLKRYQRSLFRRMAHLPTLITGPSGSGKELVARAVALSQFIPFDPVERTFAADFTAGFFPVNLSALSPTLIESELFGHRKGAFTGALQDREGYFAASGPYGTVFLDEVGEVDLGIQVKLLRVLQTREFQRLGDVRGEVFQGKIVAATNRDLSKEIAEGTFREDFYFRLRADVIETCPLVDLLGDDPCELKYIAEFAASKLVQGDDVEGLSESLLKWSNDHPGHRWPGNFRELEQAIRSLLIHNHYEPPKFKTVSDDLPAQLAETGWTFKQLLSVYVTELYRRTPNFEALARRLEVDRRTIKNYLKS